MTDARLGHMNIFNDQIRLQIWLDHSYCAVHLASGKKLGGGGGLITLIE